MHWIVRSARAAAFVVFALGSLAVAGWAFAYLLFDTGRPVDAFALQFAVSGVDVPLHFFLAGLALLLAPLQLAGGVRRRWPRLHRMGGWLYAASVLVGGVAGLSLAFNAQGGVASGLGFGLLAILWLLATARGVRLAVRGDIAGHRRWMCRSVALTFGAVTLRVMLGLGAGVMGWPFLQVYVAAAWASWLLNLAVCELILRWSLVPARRAAGGRHWASRPAGA